MGVHFSDFVGDLLFVKEAANAFAKGTGLVLVKGYHMVFCIGSLK